MLNVNSILCANKELQHIDVIHKIYIPNYYNAEKLFNGLVQ